MPLTPPVYFNKVDELIVFANKQAVLEWMNENQLDTSGTSVLIPYKSENKQLRFLKPTHPNLQETETARANTHIRIMGAGNPVHTHGFIDWVDAKLRKNRVPHLNELVGDSIRLRDHGFIIIYERGSQRAGKQFAELFQEEEKDLFSQISVTQTNEGPHLNEAKFMQDLSLLSLDLDIKVGMSYFARLDNEGNPHVYRHIFKQNLTNTNSEHYLQKEAELHESKRIKVKEHKSQNHHLIRFVVDWCKWTVFAAITAIGAGLILGIFVAPPIGAIAAAVVAILTFVGISRIGFVRADKNNPTTVEFGMPEFEIESEATFLSRIKQRINSVHEFFNKQPTRPPVFSNESTAWVSEKYNATPERVTTHAAQATGSKANDAIASLIKSSMPSLSLLFKCQRDNQSIDDSRDRSSLECARLTTDYSTVSL